MLPHCHFQPCQRLVLLLSSFQIWALLQGQPKAFVLGVWLWLGQLQVQVLDQGFCSYVLAQVLVARPSLELVLGRAQCWALVRAQALHKLALERARQRAQRRALKWTRAQAQPGTHASTSACGPAQTLGWTPLQLSRNPQCHTTPEVHGQPAFMTGGHNHLGFQKSSRTHQVKSGRQGSWGRFRWLWWLWWPRPSRKDYCLGIGNSLGAKGTCMGIPESFKADDYRN